MIAILICCLGLFVWLLQRRTTGERNRRTESTRRQRERHRGLLSKDFLKLVFVAIVIASPWPGYHE